MSYAGGLIGVIIGVFFVMSPYTELCFELSLGKQLYTGKDRQPLRHSMNFLKYVGYELYSLVACCCASYCCKVEHFDELGACSEQVKRELDVAYLLKRITALETLVTAFEDTKLSYDRTTVEAAEQRVQQFHGTESGGTEDSGLIFNNGGILEQQERSENQSNNPLKRE